MQDSIHTYHEGVPDLIQIARHQFAEKSLVWMWVDLMLTVWCVEWALVVFYILIGCSTGFPQAIMLVHMILLKLAIHHPTSNDSSASN